MGMLAQAVHNPNSELLGITGPELTKSKPRPAMPHHAGGLLIPAVIGNRTNRTY